MTDRSSGEWSLAVRQQAAVARLGRLGLEGGDPGALLAEAMRAVSGTLEVRSAILFELRPELEGFRIRGALIDDHLFEPGSLDELTIPSGRGSMPGFTVTEGRPVVTSDLAGDGRFLAQAPAFGMREASAVTAPIVWGDRPWGVLGVYGEGSRSWTDDEVHFVQSIANMLGLALQRHRVERELRDSSVRLDLSLAAGGLGAWSWDVRTDAMSLNRSALDMYGLEEGGFGGTGQEFVALLVDEDRPLVRKDFDQALAEGRDPHGEIRIVRPSDGEVRRIEFWGRRLEAAHPERLVGVSADVTERWNVERLNDALLAREKAARVDAEAAHDRLMVLAEASALFSTSLDPEVIVAALADFCVPRLADVCVIDLLDESRRVPEAATAAVDPRALDVLRSLREAAERAGTGMFGSWAVAEGRRPVLRGDVSPDVLGGVAGAADADAVRAVGPRSAMAVPLVARGRGLGALTLVLTGEDRRYDAEQLALAEELAARAALAIDNARLFESRNRVARSLQAALLPPALPDDVRLEFAAKYRVAEADTEIGGDFYDVMEVTGPAWGVVVGDVCGRGPDAAALTGLVRHSLRAATVRESLPSRVLAHANAAVLSQIQEGSFCTAAFLRMEPTGDLDGRVRVLAASAGHPRPVVVRADGRAELLDCPGQLLGVVPRPELQDRLVLLYPGDAVVLYTDGVTEARRGPEQFGEERLLAAAAGVAGRSAAVIAHGIDAAARGFQDDADDDAAVLVARVRPIGD